MVAKRVSDGKKIAKGTSTAAKLRVSSVRVTSKSQQAARAGSAGIIDPEIRRQLVAAEAYFLAERRGFAAGNELEDWVAAERLVDSRLNQERVA
jgi:Protein of unknown function (DUF2934)